MIRNQFSKITKPVIIMPFHFNSALLYHALTSSGVQVLGFWDNNPELSGDSYDGIKITLPPSVDTLSKNVSVIIYYKTYEEDISKQLTELGYSDFISAQEFDLEKLDAYISVTNEEDIARLRPEYSRALYKQGAPVNLQPINSCEDYINTILSALPLMKESDHTAKNRRVLLLSHDLKLAGASIALRYLAGTLVANGDIPVVISKVYDKLLPVLLKDNIPVIVDYKLQYSEWFIPFAMTFDLVVVNTFTESSVAAIKKLNGLPIPVLWWIHEAHNLYEQDLQSRLPKRLENNVNVYCVSEIAKTHFSSAMPQVPTDMLLYGMDDMRAEKARSTRIKVNPRLKIMTVGLIYDRKGQDIFCAAIRKLDDQIREACEFVFVGRASVRSVSYTEVMKLRDDYPELVTLTGEISRHEIKDILQQCDCMVCASRDDPMPIFITEAMMFSKICICSEYAGNSAFIEDGVNGFVYGDNDPAQLAEKLRYAVEHFAELDDMRKKSREVYDRYFSLDVFRRNAIDIIGRVCADAER